MQTEQDIQSMSLIVKKLQSGPMESQEDQGDVLQLVDEAGRKQTFMMDLSKGEVDFFFLDLIKDIPDHVVHREVLLSI